MTKVTSMAVGGTIRNVPQRRLNAARAQSLAEEAAGILARDARVQLVFLFGSAADPNAAEVDDIDLAVLSEPTLWDDDLLRLRAALVEATHAAVDLVSLDRASIVLAHEVADHGRCLFARRPETETDFVVRARARYWDFKPFLKTQWDYAGERLQERRRGA